MKNKFLSAAVFVFIIVVQSCKNDVPQLAFFIPKDASAIFTVDPKSIQEKIAESGISIDSLANLFSDKNDQYAMKWNDIKNSGINLGRQLYFFSKPTSSVKDGKVNYAAVIAEVEDEAKLEAFFKKQVLGGDILSGGKYKYVLLDADNIAGWTDKVLIISSVTGGYVASGNYKTGQGTPAQLYLTTLFNQNESASIAAVSEFRETLSKSGDIHFYTSSDASLSAVPMLGMTKANSLLEGGYTEGAINFEKGKITAIAETHNNKTLASILGKYPSREIDEDMVKNYPAAPSAFGVISFNPKLLLDILNYLGVNSLADNYTSNLGFTTADVMNAFSGDIAVVFSGVRTAGETYPGKSAALGGEYVLNLRIGDKAAFDKVMTGLTNAKLLSKNGNYYQLGLFGGPGVIIEATNNSLLIGSGEELLKTYAAGNNKSSLPAEVEKEINDKSMAFYADINSFLRNHSINGAPPGKTSMAAQTTFKDFIITGDKSDGKTVKGNFILNFMNSNENSLASLAKFISVAREDGMLRKKNYNVEPPMTDSMPPMPDEPAKDSE